MKSNINVKIASQQNQAITLQIGEIPAGTAFKGYVKMYPEAYNGIFLKAWEYLILFPKEPGGTVHTWDRSNVDVVIEYYVDLNITAKQR